jgi:hypothetical protein
MMFRIFGTATGTAASAAPTNLTATLSTPTQAVLNWTDNAPTTELGFYIERSTTSGSGFTRVGTVPANTTTWTDVSGLALGTTYFYRVQAFEAAGGTAFTNEASVTASNIPNTPSGLTVQSATLNGIVLNWTDNASNETGFQILRSIVSGSGYAVVGSVAANVSTFTDISSSLAGGFTYFYVVRAISPQGNSANSNQVSATFPQGITTPTNLTATAASGTQIDLRWTDNSNNETGFSIERSLQAASGFAAVGNVAANATTYNDNGLSAATIYYYRVRATGSGGNNSGYSNVANATTTGATVTSLSELFSIENASVYPNPTRDYFRIEIKTQQSREVTVTLLNLKGATLANRILGFDGSQLTTAFYVEALPAGIYILKITDGVQATEKKIVVE